MIQTGGALTSVTEHPGETVAVLAVAALYVALILVLPWQALTRTARTTTATLLALVGVTALGVTTAVALADDPSFSLVLFVQSPVLIAAGATAAALLALFGALRSIEQQREAAAAREAAERDRDDRRIVLDSEIAEADAGLRWTSQFSQACRAVLDASDPVEIATALEDE